MTRGGKREGAGRPAAHKRVRENAVTIYLSDESKEKLKVIKNKSRYIDNLIRGDK